MYEKNKYYIHTIYFNSSISIISCGELLAPFGSSSVVCGDSNNSTNGNGGNENAGHGNTGSSKNIMYFEFKFYGESLENYAYIDI